MPKKSNLPSTSNQLDGNFQQKNLFRYDMAVYMIIPSESRAIGYNRAAIPLYLSGGNRALLKIIY